MYYNVQAEAFVATFVCYVACIKAVIGMFGLLGTSGALLGGLLVASEPLLGLFGAYLGLSWWQSSPICVAPGDVGPVGAFWTLFGPLQVVSFPLLDV